MNKCGDCMSTIESDCWCQNKEDNGMGNILEQSYRAYYFGNFYLSSIQQGIQAAHVTSEMWNDWIQFPESDALETLMKWSNSHKTMILLNGGDQDELEVIFKEITRLGISLGLPYAKFHESKGALNGALTSIGIVLPEEIYDFNKVTDVQVPIKESNFIPSKKLLPHNIILSDQDYEYWEIRQLLSKYGLAK